MNKLIELKNLTKNFDDQQVLRGINLDIYENEFLTLLGPSGCGKTTTLRIIAGFEEPSGGEVLFNGIEISKLPPYKREVNTVFQKYALFPHLNVAENIGFGLNLKKVDKDVIAQKVTRMLKMVGLEGFEKRDVTLLSGGQQQRVAIARALVNEPKILLLDEPLGALDAKIRKQMQIELKKIQQEVGITFIYVTHDQVEAMTMATRIVVMKDGIIQQVATPQDLYDYPVNKFVAGFIGTPQMNFVDCTLVGEGGDAFVQWGNNKLKLPADKANNPALKDYIGKEVIAGIRPEAIHDEPMFLASLADTVIDANVDVTELMGAEIYLYLTSEEESLTARVSSRSTARAGDSVKVAVDMSRVHIFDKDTEKCIIH